MSQAKRIIAYIERHGSITSKEAMDDLGIMRLSARMLEIGTDGEHTVSKIMEDGENRWGDKTRYARYFID